MELSGAIAVVTGGSRGIGLAIARALLGRGAKVMICSRNATVEAAAADLSHLGKIEGRKCDVRNEDEVRSLLESCEEIFGGLDVLVNNAGVGIIGTTVEEMTGDEFRQTLETNLFSVFYACRYAVPMMRRSGGGHIINISSLAGQNAHPRMAAYNASKFGLNGFTEALMQEVRQDGIRVSYICPGSVNTEFGGDTPSEEKAWQLQPDDIAAAAIYVLECEARALPSKIEIRPSRPPVK